MTDAPNADPPGGFPVGARQVPVPALLFSDYLPAIDDPAELLVTLYAFYLQSRRPSSRRWFAEAELRNEAALLRALARLDGGAEVALRRGLEAAGRRGTLLAASRDSAHLYAVNAPGNREQLARAGALSVAPGASSPQPIENIFILYEENVGVLSPLLAEQLREAQAEYPWPWIVAAFREAVARNRRNWRYIERILARWRVEGPDLEAIGRSAEGDQRHNLAGRYWRLVQR